MSRHLCLFLLLLAAGCGDEAPDDTAADDTAADDTAADDTAADDTDTDSDTAPDGNWFRFDGATYGDSSGYCQQLTGQPYYQIALVGVRDDDGETAANLYLTFQGAEPPATSGTYTVNTTGFPATDTEVGVTLTDRADESAPLMYAATGGTVELVVESSGALVADWDGIPLGGWGHGGESTTDGHKSCTP